MRDDITVGRFMGMVGALIWCPSMDKYLVLKRSKDKDFAGDAWECGTGRVDQGESFSMALRREVREELDIEVQPDFIIGTAHFYRGIESPEYEMIGLFYCCSLENPETVQLSWEHSEYRWVTPGEAEEFLSEGHWLARLIRCAATLRGLISPELVAYFRKTGFEL
jgi:8-oxo-dGTP diphosphatase